MGAAPTSNLHAVRTHFREHGIDALLVDGAQSLVGQTQGDPALLALDPQTPIMQVRQETSMRLVVGVGNVVSVKNALAGDLTDPGHRNLSNRMTRGLARKARIYIRWGVWWVALG